ncbi:uncharacterized protein LOC119647251 [Hermetia illucens]|uniref:uncharacterized protein LOC119647251 n=1 Tax=Hermetia illucens TaxID=343691 RepID=UPI0018CC15C3|nr:uncharacterized protein LOC119647251 [Hermetia illucens]
MKPAPRGPGPFYLEGGESCPFCEDENKIPVVINNNITTEIKKIPMNILRDDAGLITSQFADLFRNSENDDNALRKIYTNYVYKDTSNCSLDTVIKPQSSIDQKSIPVTPKSSQAHSSNENILKSLNQPQSNMDPNLVSYFMQLKQQTNRVPLFEIDQELGPLDAENSRCIGLMVQSVIDDYKKKFNIDDQKDQLKKVDCNSVGKKALHICRQKDPYLREIHLAIFGGGNINFPKEDSDDYHKLAQEYALFRATPSSTCDSSTSKNDYSPSKNLSPPQTSSNTMKVSLSESKPIDFKRTTFEDPAIISDDMQYPVVTNHHQPQQQQSMGNPYSNFDSSNFFLPGTSGQGNFMNPNVTCGSNMNPYQMPGSFLAYANLNQKPKPRTTPKLPPPAQLPMFLTPHQYLMQAAQGPTYPTSANYPQTLMQPQANFPNLQAPAPFYNASFKETHINTAIIQQHQYQQYNVLAAAAAGNYEMLVYEQMLHQTQKIKTVVARNRLDKRLQAEMAKNASKTNTVALPAISAASSSSLRPAENLAVGSSSVRNLFNQTSSSGIAGTATTVSANAGKAGISDPAVISAVDSGSKCSSADLEGSTLEVGTEQSTESVIEE